MLSSTKGSDAILSSLLLCQCCWKQWGTTRWLSHGVKLRHLTHGAKGMGVFQSN